MPPVANEATQLARQAGHHKQVKSCDEQGDEDQLDHKRSSRASAPALPHFGTRPAAISRRHRAISRTTASSDSAIAVHSRRLMPTTARSDGSKAYITHSLRSV